MPKLALRDVFKTTGLFDPTAPSLARLGALYYAGFRADQPEVQQTLRQVVALSSTADPQAPLLALHASVILAQNGQFDGVEAILHTLRASDDAEQLELAETALRNCNQFPLAVLAAEVVDMKRADEGVILDAVRLSDDDLTLERTPDEQAALLARLGEHVARLHAQPRRPGRDIALGAMISLPVRREDAYRYSGFVALTRQGADPLVAPFDLGDVLNRNDRRARQDVDRLLRRPGRRALVVYDTNAPYETQQLYVISLPPVSEEELAPLMGWLALNAEGLRVGVAAEVERRGSGYRLITVDGDYRWETFKADMKRVGSCGLLHPLNGGHWLNTDLWTTAEVVQAVAQRFMTRTSLERAAWAGFSARRASSALVTASGRLLFERERMGPTQACCVDVRDRETEPIYRAFALPGCAWRPDEVTRIHADFKRNTAADLAVWVKRYDDRHTFVSREGHSAIIYGALAETSVGCIETVRRRRRPAEGGAEGEPDDAEGQDQEGAADAGEDDDGADAASAGADDEEVTYRVDVLAGIEWRPEERAAILSEFLRLCPQARGVVLEGYEYRGRRFARVIHPTSGEMLRGPLDADVAAGTLAYCETGQDGRVYASVVSGYRIVGGCPTCFGTAYRLCAGCGGTAVVTCPVCGGAGEYTCPDCAGSGRSPCGHCGGLGQQRRECGVCGGTGGCRGCEGSGLYTIGPCKTCNGTGQYGYAVCNRCGGSGKYRQPCNRCNSTGRCHHCKGSGAFMVECRTCSGTGRWNCERCRRSGKVRCTCQQGGVTCPLCQGERITRCGCGGARQGQIAAV